MNLHDILPPIPDEIILMARRWRAHSPGYWLRWDRTSDTISYGRADRGDIYNGTFGTYDRDHWSDPDNDRFNAAFGARRIPPFTSDMLEIQG